MSKAYQKRGTSPQQHGASREGNLQLYFIRCSVLTHQQLFNKHKLMPGWNRIAPRRTRHGLQCCSYETNLGTTWSPKVPISGGHSNRRTSAFLLLPLGIFEIKCVQRESKWYSTAETCRRRLYTCHPGGSVSSLFRQLPGANEKIASGAEVVILSISVETAVVVT